MPYRQQVSLCLPVSAFSPSGEYRFIIETIIPPLPIKRKLYRCDRQFALDAIEPLFETHGQLGIVIVGGDTAEIWIQEHTRNTRVAETSMHRQKAQKKGGQSAQRFCRIRMNQIDEFVDKVIDLVIKTLPIDKIKDIVVAGHSELFMQVADAPGIKERVKQIIRTDGLEIDKIVPKITITIGATEATALAEQLFEELDTDSSCIIYGPEAIRSAAAANMIEKVVVVDSIDIEKWGLRAVDGIVKLDSRIGTRLHLMGGVLARVYYATEE